MLAERTERQGAAAPAGSRWTAEGLARQARHFEERPVEELLAWALDEFDSIALACSFGAEDVVLVDHLARLRPDARAFYLDTQLHFPETYEVRDRLQARYPEFRFEQVLPRLSVEEQADEFGPELWARDPDLCCGLRKVEPLRRVLGGLDAWITGIRREQAPTRAAAQTVEWDQKFGLVKINPLVRWTHKDVWNYIHERQIPYNALHDQGYPSIGCWPCTRAVQPGEDPRAGRWAGFGKTECGLHQ